MWNFKSTFLRMYFSLVLTFYLKLWLSDCMLLNMFQHLPMTFLILKEGLATFVPQPSFYSNSKTVEGCHEILNCHIVNFCAIFLKICIFQVVRLHKKWSFSLKEAADLVTFTEEILNRKLHFLCNVIFYLTLH